MACVDHPRSVIELEQNIREEIEAIMMDVTQRVMENWLYRVEDCTLKNGGKNGNYISKIHIIYNVQRCVT
jgi:hypothetical protein